jgi:hypothetical protein
MLVHYMTIWSSLGHFLYSMAIWYSLWSFGIFSPFLVYLGQEKSGSPGPADFRFDEFSFPAHRDKTFNSFLKKMGKVF